jgi:hypothetical protein
MPVSFTYAGAGCGPYDLLEKAGIKRAFLAVHGL